MTSGCGGNVHERDVNVYDHIIAEPNDLPMCWTQKRRYSTETTDSYNLKKKAITLFERNGQIRGAYSLIVDLLCSLTNV